MTSFFEHIGTDVQDVADASALASKEAAEAAKVAAETAKSSAESSAANAATSAANASSSESNAGTSETNSSTSATNAANSATAAATSATNAGTSETNSATSATNAANSATAGATSATNAGTSETNAATSATNAGTSETNAATSATNAAGSATTATTKAGEASTSASNAATSATSAETAKTAAETAETNAETAETNAASSATSASTSASNASTSATAASTSASAASTSETNAATSATNAGTSETNASNSATSASTSAGNASTSATAAAGSASAASTSETNAGTSATNAGTSATNAATSETNAATSATSAATSATTATTQASTSTTQAGNSATSATAASNSASSAASAQTAAEAARDSALAALDSFDDRYLGSKSSAPTVDNDGNALVSGALYFDSTSTAMKVYDGSQWLDAYASLSGALIANQNLSDLNNAATARTNLGLGTAATTAASDYATAAQGTTADNALAASAVSTFGGTLIDDADAAAARTTLGLGTAATTAASDYATAAQADQTVALTGSGGTTVSGTYPNFTVSSSVGTTGIVDNSDATAITLNSDESVTFAGAVTGTSATFTVADNSDNLTLTSTDTDDNSGPNVRLYRNSGSPGDNYVLGQIDFEGKNDASQDTRYGFISAKISDASDGTEDGQLRFFTIKGGTETQTMTLDSGNVTFAEDINVANNKSAIFGSSSSGLEVKASGTNSFIKHTGGGSLVIPTNEFEVRNAADSQYMIRAQDGGYVRLYHGGSGKLITESGGVYVTGAMDADNFKIAGAQGTDGQVLTSTGSGVAWENAPGGSVAGISSSADATAMTIDSNEKIGISLTNPGDFSSNDANNLVVGGSGSNGMTLIMGETNGDTARLDFRSTKLTGSFANIYTYIEVTSPFGNSPHDQMIFAVQDEEAMRIVRASSSEYVLIGKSSANLDTNGFQSRNGYEFTWTASSSQYPLNIRSGGSYTFEVRGNGQIKSAYTSISSISDERVKENIVGLETGLTQIMALQPRRFDFKDGEGSGEKNVAGFVAQEVESVLPDLVDFSRHKTLTDCKSLKMGDMIPTMVKAMQEQQAVIESLTNRIAALEQ